MDWLQNLRFLLHKEEYKAHLNDLDELAFFTLQENGKSDRITKLVKAKWNYNFEYQNKNYPFSFFSNRKLQEYDIKTLLNKEKREKVSTDRTLKLACSMDLVNPKVLVGKSNFDCIIVLFSFLEDGIEKIVDYSKNLVMTKNDYFELFKLSLYNELDKYDLYRIWHFMNDANCFELKNSFLLFSDEMILDLGKNYPYLIEKYNGDGMNLRNLTLFSDDLFFKPNDDINQPFLKTRERIDNFTMNPTKEDEVICYDEKEKRYLYFDEEFGGFLFRLFSDYVIPEEQKALLSEQRYHHCHLNAIVFTIDLYNKYPSLIHMANVVSGKVKRNEVDFYYHSWIELVLSDQVVVIDYNHNLIMPKEEYYKLYKIEVISKTSYKELTKNLDFLCKIWGTNYSAYLFNYFGNELTRDLKRNKHLFKEMQE